MPRTNPIAATKKKDDVRDQGRNIKSWPRVFGSEKDYIAEHLSMMLSSGMDVVSVFKAVEREAQSKSLRKVLSNIREGMEDGEPLWQMFEQSRLFPPHAVSLVRIGEQAGRLSQYLQLVAQQQEREKLFTSRLRSAMLYPAIVSGIAVIVGLSVAWFILPKLAIMFTSMNMELPLITRIMIWIGAFLNTWGLIAVPLIAVAVVTFVYLLFFAPKTKHIGQSILLKLPIISTLVREVEIARFGFIMGTLLEAGLPAIDSLNALGHSSEVVSYQRLYYRLQKAIEEGLGFNGGFNAKDDAKLVPFVIQQMIASGEQSGHLAKTFSKVGETYEAKADLTTKNLSVLLEPILLVVLCAGVLVIALAVILPIYRLVGGMRI